MASKKRLELIKRRHAALLKAVETEAVRVEAKADDMELELPGAVFNHRLYLESGCSRILPATVN